MTTTTHPATVALPRAMGLRDLVLFNVVAVLSLRWFATSAASLAQAQNEAAQQDDWTSWWQRGGFDHVERFDDRVRLFATRLSEGRQFSMSAGFFARFHSDKNPPDPIDARPMPGYDL